MNRIKETIEERLKLAMKEGNPEKLNVLRSIKAKITETEKNNMNKQLSDEEVIKVIEKLAKQREESIELFKQGNREDLLVTEQYQLDYLKQYIPEKYDEQKTREIVETLIKNGASNIGLLMKELNQYGNMLDKKLASSIAKELF